MRKRVWYGWLFLLVSFGGFARGVHPEPLNHLQGAMAHYRVIDTSERPDEHVRERITEVVHKV